MQLYRKSSAHGGIIAMANDTTKHLKDACSVRHLREKKKLKHRKNGDVRFGGGRW
jgi:hypothetical protein